MPFPATTTQGGQCMAMPDVCKTPTPAGPVPIPYPNIAMPMQADVGTCTKKVTIACAPALTLNSQITMTSGDEAGSAGGVVSGKIKGPAKYSQGSMKVMLEGAPAVYMTSPTQHNGSSANAPTGVQIAPSQAKVIVN